jgi:hypothetical protein
MSHLLQGQDSDVLYYYLKHKWEGLACEVCKHDNWNLLRADGYPCGGLPGMNTALVTTAQSWPMLGVLCTTCGNTKLLFVSHVLNWANSEEGQKVVAAMKEEGA